MGTSWTEEAIDAGCGTPLPVRIHRSGPAVRTTPLVLHLHGGAFVGGSAESGRLVPTLLAEAGAVVVSVDYPTAPEHPFPAALHAGFGLLHRLHGRRSVLAGRHSRLFVAGEEAGGNLAAGLALMVRDQQAPPLAGQILLSPMLDPCLSTTSIRTARAGPAGCRLADGWDCYLGSAETGAHPYAAPSSASRLADLAPALVVTAADDPMQDEALTYARRLREAGVPVHEHVLAAPTGWPDTLMHDMPPAGEPEWPGTLRGWFHQFFAQTATRRPSPPIEPAGSSL